MSFIVVLCLLELNVISCIIISLIVGAVSAVSELYSKNGNDTVICPLSAMVALLPLVYLFGGM